MNQTLIALLLAVAPAVLMAQLPEYVPTQNLVGWYHFDGDAENFGGNSSDGTVYGATAAVNRFDDFNSALSFDGSNDYVEIPHSEELLIGGGSATWAFWCKIPNVSHGLQSPLITNYVTPTTPLFGMYVGGVNEGDYEGRVQIHYRTNSAGSEVGCQSDFRVDDSNWHHIAGVLDADQDSLLLYIDGILAATRYALAGSPDSYQSIVLGGNHLGRFFEVAIDDVGIWSQALPADQIQALFDGSATQGNPIEEVESGCELFSIQELAEQNLMLMDSILALNALLNQMAGGAQGWSCGDDLAYQGYSYKTVQIGEQCWFAENLRAENYLSGSQIPLIQTTSEWMGMSTGGRRVYGLGDAQCGAEGDTIGYCNEPLASVVSDLGYLYNWHVVSQNEGVCPANWHVPNDSDFETLLASANQIEGDAFSSLKSQTGWADGKEGTNTSGFNALGSGYGGNLGNFGSDGYFTGFWSVDEAGPSANASHLQIDERPQSPLSESVFLNDNHKRYALSIRRLKDQ